MRVLSGPCCCQVWTNDLEKGAELAARIQSGVRGVNAHPGGGPGTVRHPCGHPFSLAATQHLFSLGQVFGGVKQSGLGVEGGGDIGLKEFLDVTTLRIAKTGLSGK